MLNALLNALKALGRGIAREPAQLTALVAASIQVISAAALPLTAAQQGGLNALATALFGFVAASMVSSEKAAPAFAGLVQAALSCALAFDLQLDPAVQSAVMAAVSALVGFFMRTQVEAPGGAPRGRHADPMEG
jgi:nicotinamide riboside transporter PnuC